MTSLVLAALFWVGLHGLVAGPLRPALLGRIGTVRFRAVFGLLSAVGIVWLFAAHARAPYVELWSATPGIVPVAVMPIAFIFLVASLTARNPTLAGADVLLRGNFPVHGIIRVTRHPMLWAFALWAGAHMITNGDLAALLAFGAILITAVNGMFSIDRKRARADAGAWQAFAAATSRLPFAAIAAGRNRFVAAEIGWWRLALALVLYAGVAHWHGVLFGVPVRLF